jgi:signal transduction histidine kinase
MTWRVRSVRKRILLLALVPLLSLFGLYVFTTSVTARNAINLARANTLKNATGQPTGNFERAIQTERLLAVLYLAAPTPANQAKLNAAARATDRQAAALHTSLMSGATMDSASEPQKRAIDALLANTKTLPAVRAQVAARTISRPAALARYNTLVAGSDQVLNQTIRQETNSALVSQGLAFVRIGRAGDLLGQEDAIFVGDMAAGSFPAADRRQFAQLAGARRYLVEVTLPDLDSPYRDYYARDVDPQASAALTALENNVMSAPLRHLPAVSPLAWQQAFGAVAAGLSTAGNQSASTITAQASNIAWSTNRQLIITGGIGLLLVIISIIVAILTARSLVRELNGLRQSALTLANERLPEVVDRLALGQDVDTSADAPDIPASSDEIGQVRDAFAAVQQTAIQAAVGQARLRQGMSEVFRNLARRSQSLLHRQLTLLDAMERRARDPQELEDLFRIDHLTTRMRRHAESLIILSGHPPARGWRNPVPLVDVLRAAVAEVEDYTRIRATSATGASLAGPAVGDVIHLIAELAENATMFSPPNTPVVVHGDIVGKGFAVEIEDRGLGLSDEQLEHVNELLANPPPFDPSTSDQLGLFVAGQLAKRHDIKITLRASPYGGITAIVIIPQNLVVPEGGSDPSVPAVTDGTPWPQTRHALDWPGPDGGTRASLEPTAAMPAVTAAAWPDPAPPALRSPADAAHLSPAPLPRPGFPEPRLRLEAGGFSGSGRDTGDTGETGLPRRVRQASLAPQLRETAADPAPGSGGDFWTRSPEDTRSTMSAIQQGWERGRSGPDAPSASTALPTGTASPASTAASAGDDAETGTGPAGTQAPDAGPAGTYQSEPASEDRGTSG